jgi:hypothetical protein
MEHSVSYRIHQRARVQRARALRLVALRAMRAVRRWWRQFGDDMLWQSVRPLPAVDR